MAAIAEPRQIDEPLVSAYLARRALDYLVGFTLSPVLWRKLPGARSAGRVQSVALRLICDREAEIEAFRSEEYWTIEAVLATAKGEEFPARLNAIDGTTLKKLDIKDEATAHGHQARHRKGRVPRRPRREEGREAQSLCPVPTSTLQMDASRKLGFSAKQTMQIAQRLYEGVDIGGETVGLITYMRTDGVTIVPRRINAIRGLIAREYSQRYVAALHPRVQDQGQERPGGARGDPPDRRDAPPGRRPPPRPRPGAPLRAHLEARGGEPDGVGRGRADDRRHRGQGPRRQGLYAARHRLRHPVRRLPQGLRGGPRRPRPPRREGQGGPRGGRRRDPPAAAARRGRRASPTARSRPSSTSRSRRRGISEATLVKRMEELGIGRPSTYASTLAVLQERDYVRTRRSASFPRTRGVSSSPSSKASSSATSSTTSRPTSRRSSTSSPTASSSGRTSCAISGGSSRAPSTRSRTFASATCSKP